MANCWKCSQVRNGIRTLCTEHGLRAPRTVAEQEAAKQKYQNWMNNVNVTGFNGLPKIVVGRAARGTESLPSVLTSASSVWPEKYLTDQNDWYLNPNPPKEVSKMNGKLYKVFIVRTVDEKSSVLVDEPVFIAKDNESARLAVTLKHADRLNQITDSDELEFHITHW